MERQREVRSVGSDVTKDGMRARKFRQSFVEWWNLAAQKSEERQEATEQRKPRAA